MSPRLSMQRIKLIVLLLMLTGALPTVAKHLQPADLPSFSQVGEGFYRGGQPSEEGLKQLKKMGIKTVISLRHNHSQVIWEKQKATALDMAFQNLPMDGLHEPKTEFINKFLKIVHDPANQPVFVHCEWGLDRTGCLVAIYREEAQQWSAKKAYDEMVSKGFEKRYAWLADAVWDYEEDRVGSQSRERPFSVKLYDSITPRGHTKTVVRTKPTETE